MNLKLGRKATLMVSGIGVVVLAMHKPGRGLVDSGVSRPVVLGAHLHQRIEDHLQRICRDGGTLILDVDDHDVALAAS